MERGDGSPLFLFLKEKTEDILYNYERKNYNVVMKTVLCGYLIGIGGNENGRLYHQLLFHGGFDKGTFFRKKY